MSDILKRFDSKDEEDTIWQICSIISICICGIAIFIFFRTIQHLYCLPLPVRCCIFEPKHIKIYSTLSITFAFLSCIINFSMYPVCTVSNCWTNFTHHFSLPIRIFWPFYTLAKIFVYLIFIGRLFNPYYARIHQYSKCIQYLLWIFVWVLVIETIAYKIQDGLLLAGIDVPLSVDKVLTAIYSILDVLMSVLCMSLFFFRYGHGVPGTRMFICRLPREMDSFQLFR